MSFLSRFWPWKSEPKAAKITNVQYPRVIFDCLPGGRIVVSCDWPEADNQDHLIGIGRGLAGMLFYINDGQLRPLTQQAVAVAAHLKNQDRFGEHVLTTMQTFEHKAMEERGESPQERKSGPVVPADEVFSRD